MASHRSLKRTIVFALAGGKGTRLGPLTTNRAKPSVPFGAKWTILDLVLWSMYRSGFNLMYVLTQYCGNAIAEHLMRCWPLQTNGYPMVRAVAPEFRHGTAQYEGTADAVHQNLHLLGLDTDNVFIVGGDHIFLMDGSQVLDFHNDRHADITILAHEVTVAEARSFGVMQVDTESRLLGFREKPMRPREIPGKPGYAYASMGIYLFTAEALRRFVGDHAFRERCIAGEAGDFDFGKHVIPEMLKRGARIFAYPFVDNVVPDQEAGAYWRDVGTIGAYFAANMDLVGDTPLLNLYSSDWPIPTPRDDQPPLKVSLGSDIDHSLLSGGCIVTGSAVTSSILSQRVHVRNGSRLDQCIVFRGVDIGEGCDIRRCIIEEGTRLPAGTRIGHDADEDAQRFYVDEDSGIVIVTPDMLMM